VDLSDRLSYRALRLLRHGWRRGETRTVAILDFLRPRGLFQPHGKTGADRYPAVFAFVGRALGDGAGARLLSFGCSTGEEVFTLRRYCPRAAITGLDISAARIATCRARLAGRGGDPGITFAVASTARGLETAGVDAIFAMAVFRHGRLGDVPETCAAVIRFADVAVAIDDLARCLRPGGFFAIRNANFRFADTPAAADFDLVLSLPAATDTPVYGRDDRLLPREALEQVVFRKRAGSDGAARATPRSGTPHDKDVAPP
jgi:SAM-dependent methyltransferase